MGYGIKVRARGGYALFTRPEMKVERVSYDVITPSAARGLIEAVYWKPAIRWVIDRIHVLSPIAFTNIRRNEVADKSSTDEVRRRLNGVGDPFYIDAVARRQQRAAIVLVDVHYLIEAHFELVVARASADDTPEKHYNMVMRRLRKGQFHHAPCLGTREFPACVELVEDGPLPTSPHAGVRDLGWMLYDMDFSNPSDIQPKFFKAELRDGVLDLTRASLRS